MRYEVKPSFKIYSLNKEFNFYYLISQDAEDIEDKTECELFYESEFQKIPLVRDSRTRQIKNKTDGKFSSTV